MKKKGFSFIEVIIVVAIIGILAGILLPSWGYAISRARTRTQNNKAKSIFNAAQTVVTDLKFAERRYIAQYNAATTSAEKDAALSHIYSHVPGEANEFWFYWDGTEGYRVVGDPAVGLGAPLNNSNCYAEGISSAQFALMPMDEWNDRIGSSVKKIVDEEMVYKIWVKDYVVMAVVSARGESDAYIGAYPVNLDRIDEGGKQDVDAIRSLRVRRALMDFFDLYTADIE